MKRFLLILALLVACGDPPLVTHPVTKVQSWRGVVEEIVLSDGTRCAIYVSQGISCDWSDR